MHSIMVSGNRFLKSEWPDSFLGNLSWNTTDEILHQVRLFSSFSLVWLAYRVSRLVSSARLVFTWSLARNLFVCFVASRLALLRWHTLSLSSCK